MCEWTRDWLRLRRERAALRRGDQIDLAWDEESYLFARREGKDLVLIAINRGKEAREISAPAAWLGLDGASIRLLAGNAESRAQMVGPNITVRLPPETIAAFDVQPAR